MQLWAVSVIVYFISSLSCHLFTFLETATPWNKWPVLLSHGQGCFLQLITSRNATDRNAFRLFAKKTNISSLSENITFPQKVNCSVSFSGHVKFLLCYDRSLNRSWWHTVVAQNASQSLQLHTTAGSGTEVASFFPLTQLTQGLYSGSRAFAVSLGLVSDFPPTFHFSSWDASTSNVDVARSCVCQPLRFTSQKQQPGELAPSRCHTPLSVQTHYKKARRGAMCHYFWVF